MTFFHLWNTKREILKNLPVVLSHAITMNGEWSFQALKNYARAPKKYPYDFIISLQAI